MLRQKSLILILLLCSNLFLLGQDLGSLNGIVKNEDGEYLYGANIIIHKAQRGAATDKNGKYIIRNIPKGKFKVSASYIGYKTVNQEITIIGDQTLDFVLKESPLQSKTIVITGTPAARSALESPQDINQIEGLEKSRIQAASLGGTIESLPGIYNVSAGSVAGKPVIRGQTGERIRILADGIAQEYQQYGERHAPNIDPFNYERIEVIKGAASLIYGSDAIGGAVNLIPNHFHFGDGEATALGGSISSNFRSNNNEIGTGIKLHASHGKIGINGSFNYRDAGNFHSPDAETFEESGQNGDPKFTGEINNTDFDQLNGSIGIGALTGLGLLSADYDHYQNSNNFLLPNGKPIGLGLTNQTAMIRGNSPLGMFFLKSNLSFQKNHRQATKGGQSRELLPDSANVDLVTDVYSANFKLEHDDISNLTGTWGAEVKYYNHENNGSVSLQPDGHYLNFAAFAFDTWKINRLIVDFGLRLDYRDQLFEGSESNPLLINDRESQFTSIAGALGASYRLHDDLSINANIGRGFRAPSFYNLYVYGYHGGVFAFQIGNPDLVSETSLDLSGSLRYFGDKVNATATYYRNQIDDYIYLYNAPEHELAPEGETFVFAQDQADAILNGIEVMVEYSIFNFIKLGGSYSMLRSEFSGGYQDGQELPMMPSDRFSGNIEFYTSRIAMIRSPYIKLGINYTADKDAAGIYEPFGQFDDGIGPDIPFGTASTEAYNTMNLGIGFAFSLFEMPINLDFEVSNLMDVEYRDFLDTYKGYALAPGRSFNIKLNYEIPNINLSQ
ncbi:MAG: TonB-dependent receptor [Candidatus Zixiibacteriota bacterium]